MNITVLIPTKDGEGVYRAIESILSQDHGDFEILVVDDHSAEVFSSELQTFCEGEDKVRYIHKSEHPGFGSGLNGSRNLGAEEADGEAVAFLDDDCVATEGWLEELSIAFEGNDVVESRVEYVNEGKNCPMDRVIQNVGERYRFLGAGLSFRKEVGEEIAFEERFRVLRGDTAFGFRVLEKGYSYTYAEDAVIEHHSGRFSPGQFVKERLRFVEEPLFFQTFRDNEHLEEEISHVGRVLHPKELVYLAALSAAFLLPLNYAAVPLVMGLGELVYLHRESKKRRLDVCPRDILLLFFLVPLALIAKRLAIWKGAIKYNVFVV